MTFGEAPCFDVADSWNGSTFWDCSDIKPHVIFPFLFSHIWFTIRVLFGFILYSFVLWPAEVLTIFYFDMINKTSYSNAKQFLLWKESTANHLTQLSHLWLVVHLLNFSLAQFVTSEGFRIFSNKFLHWQQNENELCKKGLRYIMMLC